MQVISIRYDLKEELYNILTHGFAFLLSIAALVVLVVFASLEGSALHVVSFSIFGASMVVLYFASTVFHMTTDISLRKRLNVFDHSAIFLLIAGTYTPFTLVVLNGPWGWSIFGVIWGMALAGIILKLFFTGRFRTLSTLLYLFMGWTILVAIYPLYLAFSGMGMFWLIAGGVSYSAGAVFFLMEKLPYNHVIFHLLVMMGSACHFVAVFWYVL
jgi:hemolysin III